VNKIVQSSRVQKFKVKSETSQETNQQPAAIARRRAIVIVFVKRVRRYAVGRLIKHLALFKLGVFGL